MARMSKNDFENQLMKKEEQIKQAEKRIEELKLEKEQILQNKKEYELEEIYKLAVSKGKTLQDIIKEISKS